MTTKVEEKLAEERFTFTADNKVIPHLWQVLTTEDLNEIQVAALSGLPQMGDELAGTEAKVTAISGQRQRGKKDEIYNIWDISVTYEAEGEGSTESPAVPGVATRLIAYALGHRSYSKVPEQFFESGELGGSIQNTAGQPFDNPPTVEKYNTVIRWTQRENPWFKPSNVAKYMNTINRSGVTVVDTRVEAGKGLLRLASSALKRDADGVAVYETTYEVEMNPDGFDLNIRNQGFQQLIAGKLVDILKSDLKAGEPDEKVNEPVDLDENGLLLVSGDPIYISFEAIKKTSWGSLDMLRSVS